MDPNLAAAVLGTLLWSCFILARSSPTPRADPQPPRLLSCVFRQRANITCRWEPGETQRPAGTGYTLTVEKMRRVLSGVSADSLVVLQTFSCSSPGSGCTVQIHGSSVAFTFCIAVAAHTPNGVAARSERRCQSGRKEVMLAPVHLSSVEPVAGQPQCLLLTWERPMSYIVSEPEMRGGNLTSQIEYSTKLSTQTSGVAVTAGSFLACVFRPDCLYAVRLRHRFWSEASPWSPWSNARQGQTVEDAPSAAPSFWWRVTHEDTNGWRHTLLLWKPLRHSLANGRIRSYEATCRGSGGESPGDPGSCGVLPASRTSCAVLLPPQTVSCSLAASNSAGSSPQARVWLLGVSGTGSRKPALGPTRIYVYLPPPGQLAVTPLDDHSLDVRWAAPPDPSVSGFVVEWFAVTADGNASLHWERLNGSCAALLITGVEPLVFYAVSVKAEYCERGTAQSATRHVYTRQGAPSAGPKVEVQAISANKLDISWRPIPVDQQHGYIRNYTLHYTHAYGHPRNHCVPAEVLQYSILNLSPGYYNIYMQANTDAGSGAAGPISNVFIGPEEMSLAMVVVKGAIFSTVLTLLLLMLTVWMVHSTMVNQKLWRDIPDPSKSSLARWSPKNVRWTPMTENLQIHNSEITWPIEPEDLRDASGHQVQVVSYHALCAPHTHSGDRCPSRPPPPGGALTPAGKDQAPGSPHAPRRASQISIPCCGAAALSNYASVYAQICSSSTASSPPPPPPHPRVADLASPPSPPR